MKRFTQSDYPLTEEQVEECFNEEKVEFIVDITLTDLIQCYSIDDINTQCDEVIFGENNTNSAYLADIGFAVEGKTDSDTVAISVVAEVIDM